MRERKTGSYGRALLFERLEDLDPQSREEARPFRALSKEAVKESVRRELAWLLNTRCPVPAAVVNAQERTVVNYGIPELSSFAPEAVEDHRRLALMLARTIEAYELRMRDVRVTVEKFTRETLVITIRAVLQSETVAEPVAFRTVISSEAGGGAQVETA